MAATKIVKQIQKYQNWACRKVKIPNTNVLALPTTGIEIVAAAGANKILLPVFCFFQLVWSADYTNIDAGATLGIQTGTSGKSVLAVIDNALSTSVEGLLAGGASALAFAGIAGFYDPAGMAVAAIGGVSNLLDTDLANDSLIVKASNGGAGNFTGGNALNNLYCTVYYLTINLETV
jgi:hypothetical protein